MPYYGEGLDGFLSARHMDLQGIVNGIDYEQYDPVEFEYSFVVEISVVYSHILSFSVPASSKPA